MAFVGRDPELAVLYRLLAEVSGAPAATASRIVLVSGRRRVGKSRLVEEFLARAVVPHGYLTATSRTGPAELNQLAEQLAALPLDEPAVVVIDELPELLSGDPARQQAFTRFLDRLPPDRRILVIGISLEPGFAPAIDARQFQQPPAHLVLSPLTPADLAARLHLSAADAVEAYLVTGGQPMIVDSWPVGATLRDFLSDAVSSPTSALLVDSERALAAEFRTQTQARDVLAAIGSGRRRFAAIGRAAGDLRQGSLSRALTSLRERRLVAADVPLSTARSSETRYRVADPQLDFWLSFLGPELPEIERGHGERVLARITAGWTSWRDRAVQPVLREALGLLLAEPSAGPTVAVGGYWTRSSSPEIDVVLADCAPQASAVVGVGAIAWRENAPFNDHDYGQLLIHRAQLPGAGPGTPVFALARSGCTVPGLRTYSPEELLAEG